MPGMYVFPGGLLDPGDRDREFWSGHADLAPEEIEDRLERGPSGAPALPHAVAAIREAFEEAGVLLAEGGGLGSAACEAVRQDGRLPKEWLRQAVERTRGRLCLSRLYPWSHWITPPEMRHRFDTRFFLALGPDEQECRPDGREMVAGVWLTPEEALARNREGAVPLSPPTVVTLHEFLAFPTWPSLLEEARGRRWGEPLRPRMVRQHRGSLILEPWDPEYPSEEVSAPGAAWEEEVLPVGEAFSRLWFDGRIWRAVRV